MYYLYFLTAALAIVTTVNCSYPKNLPRCKTGDNVCLPNVIMEVLRKARDGSPEMNLPPFDPLKIPQVNIIQGKESTIAIELYFKDCNFYGIADAIVNKTLGFEKNPKTSKFEVHARLPRVEMIAKYKISGQVLILPITGNGKSNLTLDNVDIKLKFQPTINERNGKTFLSISPNKIKLTFDTTRMYLQLDNLFNGNKGLGDNMNLFLNENWQVILQELKPAVRETLTQIVSSIINGVFDKLPYEDIFLEE